VLVLLLLSAVAAAAAACGGAERGHGIPADPAWYLTLHGGRSADTVFALDEQGRILGDALDPDTAERAGGRLRSLRGILRLPDGGLLVANARTRRTRVIEFGPPGPDRVHPFRRVLARAGPDHPALRHTYQIALAPDGSLYASNQDSATVTRYAGPASPSAGAPLPVPPALAQLRDPPPGLFVASARDSPEGLSSVRGIAFGPDGLLYVADRDASRVAAYDPHSGKRVHTIAEARDGLRRPIQLLFSGDSLFIGDNERDTVFRVELRSRRVEDFAAQARGELRNPSALAIHGGTLYVGSRKARAILRLRLSDGQHDPRPFAENLPDAPEFLIRAR
jgi:glucose/arabinose dehydrogenase